MIDAKTFATSHNAFWTANAPTCENYVRRLNLSGTERFGNPIHKRKISDSAFISELAFNLFIELSNDTLPVKKTRSEEALTIAWKRTKDRLIFKWDEISFFGEMTLDDIVATNEIEEVQIISHRLLSFVFDGRGDSVILHPIFRGCGFIDASEADLVKGDTLFEVKTVDRPFRGTDIKQLITYAALNYASAEYKIENIGLINPRMGVYCIMNLNKCCEEISGPIESSLLPLIINAISDGGISR